MSNTRKFIVLIFTVMLVISLQFNTSITKGMENGFSFLKMMDNIFVHKSNAEKSTLRFAHVDCDWDEINHVLSINCSGHGPLQCTCNI